MLLLLLLLLFSSSIEKAVRPSSNNDDDDDKDDDQVFDSMETDRRLFLLSSFLDRGGRHSRAPEVPDPFAGMSVRGLLKGSRQMASGAFGPEDLKALAKMVERSGKSRRVAANWSERFLIFVLLQLTLREV